jgi:hypothetical protein
MKQNKKRTLAVAEGSRLHFLKKCYKNRSGFDTCLERRLSFCKCGRILWFTFNKVQDCKAMPSMFVKMTFFPFYIKVDNSFRVGNCTDSTFSKSHAKVLVDFPQTEALINSNHEGSSFHEPSASYGNFSLIFKFVSSLLHLPFIPS